MPGSHMRRNYLSHRRDNSIPGGSSTWDTVPTNEKIHHLEQQTTEMACNTATPSRLYWSYIVGQLSLYGDRVKCAARERASER